MIPAISNFNEVAKRWQWRSRDGCFHYPRDMVTRHLFHTVSMVWNHGMPADAATHHFNRYVFGPHYTTDYMQKGAAVMLRELLQRDDLLPYMKARLEFMRRYLLNAKVVPEQALPIRSRLLLDH